MGSLAEACTIIRRWWAEDEPIDFQGTYADPTGAFGTAKPVQLPHPPIIIGGSSTATLRVVADHADLWNIPSGDIGDATIGSALLDRYCTEIGRDPASIARSIFLSLSYEQPDTTRQAIAEAMDAGFQHVVLGLAAPCPTGVGRWVNDELITKHSRL